MDNQKWLDELIERITNATESDVPSIINDITEYQVQNRVIVQATDYKDENGACVVTFTPMDQLKVGCKTS